MGTDKIRLYFDDTGYVFFNVTVVGDSTIEKDIERFTILSERNRDTFDAIEYPLDQFILEMNDSNGYQVNLETKTLVFSHPVPGEPEAPQLFGKPLTEQIEELKIAQADTNTMLLEFMEATLLP